MTAKCISYGGYPVEVSTPDDSPETSKVTSADITDATDVGRSVLTAKDASAARSAIGAGEDYTLPAATPTTLGGVKQGAKLTPVSTTEITADNAAAEFTALRTLVNELQSQLAVSGVVAS